MKAKLTLSIAFLLMFSLPAFGHRGSGRDPQPEPSLLISQESRVCPEGTEQSTNDQGEISCISATEDKNAFQPAPGCKITGGTPDRPVVTCGELLKGTEIKIAGSFDPPTTPPERTGGLGSRNKPLIVIDKM